MSLQLGPARRVRRQLSCRHTAAVVVTSLGGQCNGRSFFTTHSSGLQRRLLLLVKLVLRASLPRSLSLEVLGWRPAEPGFSLSLFTLVVASKGAVRRPSTTNTTTTPTKAKVWRSSHSGDCFADAKHAALFKLVATWSLWTPTTTNVVVAAVTFQYATGTAQRSLATGPHHGQG